MPSKLELLRMEIATYLVEMETLLPRDKWSLTLLARHHENEDSHIVVSCDDLPKAVEALTRLIETVPDPAAGQLISQAPKPPEKGSGEQPGGSNGN